MSAYGYATPTTPFLSELAEQSLLFETTYATAPWTAPSMASIFTGLAPATHGVLHGELQKGRAWNHDRLAEEFETLPEALQRGGYRTFGVTTNAHASAATGFAQGFDQLLEASWEDASKANRLALGFKKELEGQTPFFLWVHYFDPHAPYHSDPLWLAAHAPAGVDWRRFDGLPMPDIWGARSELRESSGAKLKGLIALYDAEIARTDRALRELFEALEIDSSTFVLVTSDHGEGFFDHGHIGHGASLFEDQVRVPLMIRPAGAAVAPERIATPVSIVDVYPTLLQAAGLEPENPVHGIDLLATTPPGGGEGRPLVFGNRRRGRLSEGLRLDRWKYHRGADAAQELLFDLAADPGERKNLARQAPEILARMRETRARWDQQWPEFDAPRNASRVSPDQARQLRALGYAQ